MSVGLAHALDEEQQMLVDASVRLIEERLPMSTLRSYVDELEPPRAGYESLAGDLGWFGFLASEDDGGGCVSKNGLADAALVAAERGARLQPGSFAGHHAAIDAMSASSSPTVRKPLAALVEGRCSATWAFCESHDVMIHPDGKGFRLAGLVDAAVDAPDCDWLIITALGGDGMTNVLVPGHGPGVNIDRLNGLDVTRSWARVQFDGIPIESGFIVGAPGPETEARVRRMGAIAAVLTAAESVGTMHANFAQTLAHAQDRIAFGRPIGSFQAIKHLLADTSLWLEMSKALVWSAAEAVGTGSPDGIAQAHAAKSFVGEKGNELAQNCFQVFGGIGYTWEHDQHLFLRRLAADAATFGSPEWHRRQLMDHEDTHR